MGSEDAGPERNKAEELLWLLTDSTLSEDGVAKVLNELADVLWLGPKRTRFHTWVYEQFLNSGITKNLEEVSDMTEDVITAAIEDILEGKVRNFKIISNKGYEPGEMTRIFVDLLNWKIRARKTKFFRDKKKKQNETSEDILVGKELEIGYFEMPSTEAECENAMDILKEHGIDKETLAIAQQYIDGWTYKEIAEKLGKKEQAVKQRMHRCLKRIRETRETRLTKDNRKNQFKP